MQVKDIVKKFTRQYGLIVALGVITVILAVLTKGSLFNSMNISNLILQNSYIILLSVGMFFCVLTGNVDLSVGSVLAFCGSMLGVFIVRMHLNPWISMLLVLCLGVLIGLFQGSFIAFLSVPPFIATLAGELIFRGLTLYILKGHSISPFPNQIRYIASGYVDEQFVAGNIHYLTIVFAATIMVSMMYSEIVNRNNLKKYDVQPKSLFSLATKLLFAFLLMGYIFFKLATYRGLPFVLLLILFIVIIYSFIANRTVLGRHVYSVGGNRQAAILSGVNAKKIMLIVYVNSALMAAVASIIVTARLNAATTSAGTGFELDAIAACYIGGCAAGGGEGKISGVIIGALIMGILNNGMQIMGIGTDLQMVAKGIILLLAVTYDVFFKAKSR